MIYGEPGSVFALGLRVDGVGNSVTLSIPPGLTLAREVVSQVRQPFVARWAFADGARTAQSSGDAFAAPVELKVGGTGAGVSSGLLRLTQDSALASAPMGLDFGNSANPALTETPPRLRLSFRGIVPMGASDTPLIDIFGWAQGRMLLAAAPGGGIIAQVARASSGETFTSTRGRTAGKEQLLEAEWVDSPGTAGGTISLFIDGAPAGGPFRTKMKPRIPSGVAFQTNSSLGNMHDATDGMLVRELRIGFDRYVPRTSYQPVASGPVSRDDLARLVVDARSLTAPQTPQTLSYALAGGPVMTQEVTIGPIAVPAGQAYKAVLVDWSSGSGVPHPNALVMTRIAAQNCRFEDEALNALQPPWMECLPQGPVPNIAGIDYRCEAIRFGSYVQFQFGYDWDAVQMPHNPFGDPSGKHSYMVPHKWLIYDSADALLATIETPDGQPLNGTDKPAIFAGEFDGRGCAKVTPQYRWYPHGTVRSGIIWRSGDPAAHPIETVRAMVPTFDLSVPFASYTDYSVNGFDLRIFTGGAGNDGQANGFANMRVMSWLPTDYATATARAGRTQDLYKGSLYSTNSLAANAALWLKYTPFNIQGRSPVTGPGGTRDDRQIMAEPLPRYINAPDSRRAHDGTPWRDITLAYLTGYVSDAIHCFERGRNVPLYKGDAHRSITMRNHYYGPGEASTPAAQAYYAQGGRLSEWTKGLSPLRVGVPYAGDTPSTPYFGTTQIDKSHGHQFPGWGSMIFRTPEFAFLGHKFWDQNRLYSNEVIFHMNNWSMRDGAWAFMHSALAWKTASATSPRLYSREEVLAFIVRDFERFHDEHYASNPGFLHPPTSLMADGRFADILGLYLAVPLFGPMSIGEDSLIQHDFQLGYWLSALGAAEKIGFNAALRRASAKAGAVIDFMIKAHRTRIVGRINEAPEILPYGSSYDVLVWNAERVQAAGGDVTRLPRTYTELQAANGRSATWESFEAGGGRVESRDGQAMDQLMSGPAILRYLLGQTGPDLDAAQARVTGWRQAKIAAEMKRGEDAGSGWFKYLQATNNPPRSSQS